MIWRRDGHGIDILIREHLAHIDVFASLCGAGGGQPRLRALPHCLVHIAKPGDLSFLDLHVRALVGRASSADPDKTDIDSIVRAEYACSGKSRGCALKERAAG